MLTEKITCMWCNGGSSHAPDCQREAGCNDLSLAILATLATLGDARRKCLAVGANVNGIDARIACYQHLLARVGIVP